MLESRTEFAAALIGDSIVVAGGWQGQSYTSTCEQLSIRVGSDEEARRWQPLHSMTTERGITMDFLLEIAWLSLVDSISSSPDI